MSINSKYIVNEQQHKKSVVIPYSKWKTILEYIEELEDIKAYDQAKSENLETILFEQGVQEIQKGL